MKPFLIIYLILIGNAKTHHEESKEIGIKLFSSDLLKTSDSVLKKVAVIQQTAG